MQTRSSSSNSPKANDGTPLPPSDNGKNSKQATTTGNKRAEPKCEWSADEEKRLIMFLLSEISSAADGGNFKQVTWNAAVLQMAKVPTRGPNKTSGACSSKYGRLRAQYKQVSILKGLSGLGQRYTTELGMNVGVGEQQVWDDYVKKHPSAKSYTHKGFALYDLMAPLMPNLATGTNVYRPSDGTRGAASSTLLRQSEAKDSLNTGHSSPPGNRGANDSNGPSGETGDQLEEPHPSPQSSPPHPPPSPSIPARDTPGPAPSARASLTSLSYPSVTGVSSTGTSSMSGAAKRKQSALQASQSITAASKKQRTSTTGAVALNGIKESLDTFNNTFNHTLGRNFALRQLERDRADTSPERRAKAMDNLQEQENYLDDDRMIAFIDLFRADTAAADAYLAIKREGLRRKWVEKQLKETLGFPPL